MRLSILLLAASLTVSTIATANPNNSNGEKFEFLHAEIMDLRDAITDLSVDSATTSQSIESLASNIENLSDQLDDLQGQIDSLNNGTSMGTVTKDILLGVASLDDDSICNPVNRSCGWADLMSKCSEVYGHMSYVASYGQFTRGFNALDLPDVFAIYGFATPQESVVPVGASIRDVFWVVNFVSPPSQTSVARANNTSFVACAGPSSS